MDRGNNNWLYVRRNNVSFTGTHTVTRPTIEFAFNYKKFNADTTTGPDNFTPANITYVELDATQGLQNNQNYLWNDEYTLAQSGSPNPNEIANGTGTQNASRLDTLRLGGLQQTGKLEVVKDLIPATDPGTFDLQIDGAPRSRTRSTATRPARRP